MAMDMAILEVRTVLAGAGRDRTAGIES